MGQPCRGRTGHVPGLKSPLRLPGRFLQPRRSPREGLVENLVGYIRRNVLVPVPRVQSWDELNRLLLDRCLKYLNHQIPGRSQTVGAAFEAKKKNFPPLPGYRFDYARQVSATVDYYADETKFELAHYIRLLEQRPRAVKNARPVKQANLPAEILFLADRLPGGNQDFVKILRLIVELGMEPVSQAVRQAIGNHQYNLESILFYLKTGRREYPPNPKDICVKSVNLNVYDHLPGGESA